MTKEVLELKWGCLKGWRNLSEKSRAIGQRYADLGMSLSAMAQQVTPEHKTALYELIDSVAGSGGEIWNDWTGKQMTAEEAKEYVRTYDD